MYTTRMFFLLFLTFFSFTSFASVENDLKGLPLYAQVKSLKFNAGTDQQDFNQLQICLKVESTYNIVTLLNFVLTNENYEESEINEQLMSSFMPVQYDVTSKGSDKNSIRIHWLNSLFNNTNIEGVVISKREISFDGWDFNYLNDLSSLFSLCETLNVPKIYDREYLFSYLNQTKIAGFISAETSFSIMSIIRNEGRVREFTHDFSGFGYTIPIFGKNHNLADSDPLNFQIIDGFYVENEQNSLKSMEQSQVNFTLINLQKIKEEEINEIKKNITRTCDQSLQQSLFQDVVKNCF